MNLFASAVLAAVLGLDAPASPGAGCGGGNAAFRLAVDWERATSAGATAETVRLFREREGRMGKAQRRGCVFADAFDANRPTLVLHAPSPRMAAAQADNAAPDDDGPSWLRPFTFFVSVAGVYDTNINHDDDPLEAYGAVFGAGIVFETDDFEAEYIVNSHSYSHAESWSRLSHDLYTSYEHDLAKDLEAELIGEFNFKGSSDDRDLGNEYLLKPRLTWDLSDDNRLRFYGAYRLRRYDDIDPLRNARNYYVGTEFRQRLGSGHLDVGYRWEENESKGTRNRYKRQTYKVEYGTPFAGGLHELNLEFRYRPQQYEARFIDDEEEEGLRRDVRWIFTAAAGFALSRHISIHPTYRFEKRTSNDPEEFWDAHLGVLALRYTFGGARARGPLRPPPGSPDREVDDRPERPAENTASAAPNAAAPRAASASAAAPQPIVETAAAPQPIVETTALPQPIVEPDPAEPWRRRAEADRARLAKERDRRYTIELVTMCDPQALARIWKHDAGGALWLLPAESGPGCFRVFWGRYESLQTARRAESSIPAALRKDAAPQSILLALGR